MGTLSLFTPFQSAQSHRRARWLSPSLAALLFFFSLFGLTAPLSRAQTHGCAPEAPPSITGNPIPVQALPSSVLINEALSQPASNWNCSEPNKAFSQENDSWIEFYNPQDQPVNLYAAHAQISLNGGSTSIIVPFGSVIAAHSYLVIFPQEHQTLSSPMPWNIVLSVDGITIDQAAIPLLQPDQSYARVPDGATTWLYAGNPTIDASNNSTGQPVTATPTKTPKPTATPKATSTPASSGISQPISFGTQPAWGQVQLPPDPTPTLDIIPTVDPEAQLANPPANPPAPPSGGPDWWSIALIVFFALLLLAALVLGWRLFHTP